MSFIEIENEADKQSKGFVRIKSRGTTTISTILYKKHFKDKKIRLYHDAENKKIGLKPDNKGFSIIRSQGVCYFNCAELTRILIGEFYPKWNEQHQMLIFDY